MEYPFYIYGTFKEDRETLPADSFSFVVDGYRSLEYPGFLIWLLRDTDGEALLCKIRKVTRPADIGMKIHVFDVRTIRISAHGLLNTIYPEKDLWESGRDQAAEMMLFRDLFTVPGEKCETVKNAILRSNQDTLDESYFDFVDPIQSSEIAVAFNDAMQAGFRIFGHVPILDPLREHQILDFDIGTLFSDMEKLGTLPDGRHFFSHAGRRVYLHKVDRTKIERFLGVDLIYNFLDEKRLVFVQYKCQKAGGKYYVSGDDSHDEEVTRMHAIPGSLDCFNYSESAISDFRLCRCPIFIKLCKREIPDSHDIPVGVYYPLCIWCGLVQFRTGMSVSDQPHLNNHQFQKFVRNGLIGSTASQSLEIEKHLINEADDDRLKLIFEETDDES
ncbi:MAG: hypothetical protein HUJ26_00600 [Planctomycetaceae bacterium]|nr:hypothetical protein [Planctomycetaceae bacterium]